MCKQADQQIDNPQQNQDEYDATKNKCKGCREVNRCKCGETINELHSGFDTVA